MTKTETDVRIHGAHTQHQEASCLLCTSASSIMNLHESTLHLRCSFVLIDLLVLAFYICVAVVKITAASLAACYAAALLAFASWSRFAFASSSSFCILLSRRETLWSQKSRPVRLVSPVFSLYSPLSPTPATDIITVMITSGGTDWPGIVSAQHNKSLQNEG
jgi:hypothetical protein